MSSTDLLDGFLVARRPVADEHVCAGVDGDGNERLVTRLLQHLVDVVQCHVERTYNLPWQQRRCTAMIHKAKIVVRMHAWQILM